MNETKMNETITTPRGTFKVANTFKTIAEGRENGYGLYFTHYDENDKQIEIMTKHITEHSCLFAIVKK